jgi:hypothetical protein
MSRLGVERELLFLCTTNDTTNDIVSLLARLVTVSIIISCDFAFAFADLSVM